MLAEIPTETGSEPRDDKFSKKSWRRYRRYFLDPISTLFWVYIFLQLFVFDVDASILKRIDPSHPDLLHYKFLVVLAIAAILVIFAKKTRLTVAYVVFYPAVVILWKLPRLLYKHRSIPLLLALINILASVFIELKSNFVAFVMWLCATVFVLTLNVRALTWISMVTLSALLLRSYFRTVKYSFVPSRFVTLQQKIINWVARAKFFDYFLTVSDEFKDDEIDVYTREQVTRLTANLGMAVLYNRTVHYWACQLDEYREGQLPKLFSAFSYLWLFCFSVLTLASVNIGLLHIDATAFTYATPPSNIDMVHYSLVSLVINTIPQVTSASGLAQGIQIAAAFLGPILGIALLSNVIFKLRETSQEGGLKTVSQMIRHEGEELDSDLRANYQVTVNDAIEKLSELGSSLYLSMIFYLDSQISSAENRAKDF